ncbi:head decoration protein [Paenibacillus sp. GCM10027626]|uniref:head decoration protein n=1 Tax=Paenibacillus sp. GCM10027626 TaxID=3273411 RepID=UPI00362A185C
MSEIKTDFGSIDNQSFFAGTEVSALTTSVKLASGQGVLRKGALLGKAADDTYKLVDATAKASFVLAAETIDTDNDSELDVVVYKTGIFNYSALYVAEGDEVSAHKDELRQLNIHYRTDY